MILFKNQVSARKIAAGISIVLVDCDGTLTDGFTYYSRDGEELKRFNHKDGRGVFLLKKNNLSFGVLTGENSPIVASRCQKLNADFCFLGVEDKMMFLREWCEQHNTNPKTILYIGDDTNDLGLSGFVGIFMAVSDALPDVKNAADAICSVKGGYGAVREAIDWLLCCQGFK